MKNKNFQKIKKSKSFDGDNETRIKKVDQPSSKKKKNYKQEIFDEIDEFEDIDLYGKNEDSFEKDPESSNY